MLKTALFDCAISEKCCSIEGVTRHLPSFFVPSPGDLTAQESPLPGNLPSKAKKNANACGSDRGKLGAAGITVKLIHNNVYCFFITIFRLAIPTFFRFTAVTSKQAVSITLFGPRPNNTCNSKLFWSNGWILTSFFLNIIFSAFFVLMDSVVFTTGLESIFSHLDLLFGQYFIFIEWYE